MNFFETLHTHELALIQALQAAGSPFFTECMNLLRFLTHSPFTLSLSALILYGYRQKCGANLLILLVLNISLNSFLKEAFAEPRPFMMEPYLGLAHARFFGFPSGAGELLSSLFGFLILTFKKTWFTISSIFFVLLVCFSRVYLGLHFPSDIVGGWIFGLLLLALYWNLSPYVERFLFLRSKLIQTALALLVTLFLAEVSITTLLERKTFLMVLPGACLGLIWGSPILPPTSFIQRLSRVLFATLGTLLIFFFVDHSPLYTPATFFLIGLWLSFGVPLALKPHQTF